VTEAGEDRAEGGGVLVAGGGIAALEAVLALLDLCPDETRVTVVCPDREFRYRPLTVQEPFTGEPAEHHELEPLLDELGAEFLGDALARVAVADHEVELESGRRLRYDVLVVCVGAIARPAYRDAETFWSWRWDLPVDRLIERAAAAPQPELALIAPPGVIWTLPLYELALMTRRRADELHRRDLRLRLYSPERAPLELFGEVAGEAVAELLAARRIEFEPESEIRQREAGGLDRAHGGPIHAGAAIALPVIVGPGIEGLPSDRDGFIPIDRHGRVVGAADVYAAGDATDFPVKQGGLATQQADAAAEHIAARLGAHLDPTPYHPVLRGQLITGADSLHLKHDLARGPEEGLASLDYLWWPPQKVGGRYLAAWLGHTSPRDELEPPFLPLEVEVSWPHEWHGEPSAFDAEAPRRVHSS
jgi:sulfide:quinone oxidoreductase